MLVHDIRKNETRVIDFRETAPSGIHEEMLLTNLNLNVRRFRWRIPLLSNLFTKIRRSSGDYYYFGMWLISAPCCISAWSVSGSTRHAQWDASGAPALRQV